MMNRNRDVFRTVSALLFFLLLFFFGISAGKAEEGAYTITVNGGYATDENGKAITKAKPGTKVILVCEVTAGEYLVSWKGKDENGYPVSPKNRRWEKKSSRNGIVYEEFFMPRGNVVLSAEKAPQKAAEIDLRNGYFETADGDIWSVPSVSGETDMAAILVSGANATSDRAGSDSTVLDMNGDGSWDLYLYAKNNGKDVPGAIIIPTNGCSVTGDVKLSDVMPGPAWPVTIRFGEKQNIQYYNIKAEHASVVDSAGKPVKSAAPGTKLYLIPEVLDGEYVVSWKNGEVKEYFRFTEPDPDKVMIRMPRADVKLTAETKAQQALVVDLSMGFYDCGNAVNPSELYVKEGYREMLSTGRHYRYGRADIDRDSVDDVIVGYMQEDLGANGCKDISVFFIPLSGTKIRDYYAYDVPNSGAYRPVVFQYGTGRKEQKYGIRVLNGCAMDAATGEYITEAEPGTRIRLVYDEQEEGNGTRFGDGYGEWQLGRVDAFGNWPSEVLMSAHDMLFSAEIGGDPIIFRFELNEGKWECKIPEEIGLVSDLTFRKALEPVFSEYSDYQIRTDTDNRIVMDRVSAKTQKEPEPAQLYLLKTYRSGSAAYGAAECHFGDSREFYPVYVFNGRAFTESGTASVSGAYAGQKLKISKKRMQKDDGTYVSVIKADSASVQIDETSYSASYFVMPGGAVNINVTYEMQGEGNKPAPTPVPTPAEQVPDNTNQEDSVWKPATPKKSGESRLYHIAVIGGTSLVLVLLSVYLGLKKITAGER